MGFENLQLCPCVALEVPVAFVSLLLRTCHTYIRSPLLADFSLPRVVGCGDKDSR